MKKFGTLAVALAAVAMLSATPLMAKDLSVKAPEMPQAPSISEPQAPKVTLSNSLGSKGNDVMGSAQKKMENAAGKLKDQALGKTEAKEAVGGVKDGATLNTPSGAAQETRTAVTPETQAK